MVTVVPPRMNGPPPSAGAPKRCIPESFQGSVMIAPCFSSLLTAISLRLICHSCFSWPNLICISLLAAPVSNRNWRMPSDLIKRSRSPLVQIDSSVFLIRQTVSGEHSSEWYARGPIASLPSLASSAEADSRSAKFPESSFSIRLETRSDCLVGVGRSSKVAAAQGGEEMVTAHNRNANKSAVATKWATLSRIIRFSIASTVWLARVLCRIAVMHSKEGTNVCRAEPAKSKKFG